MSKLDPNAKVVTVCGGTGCRSSLSEDVFDTFEKELKKSGLEKRVMLKMTGCHGFCEKGPIVIIYPQKVFYTKVCDKDVAKIVSDTIIRNKIIDRLLYTDPTSNKKVITYDDIPFYKYQERIVLDSNGIIDPTNIEDYISTGGYKSLAKVLSEIKPKGIIDRIKRSGLRGRGGAGFPTGYKWEFCMKSDSDIKYVICNGDEGDPGAYMDRSVLEGNPHSVIEGMLIGAYAIGANEGFVYVRTEYPLAVKNVTIAIEQARELGLLGKNILGSNFNFDIKIAKGAGAFVCGEETALLHSIEGKRGIPRQRPPFPVSKGLYGKPTVINNVETWANVPKIIEKGPDWFADIGTKTSKGTKIFSLVGKVKNTGLVEVPMGITLYDVIFKIGGGSSTGKKIKAVQTGGPSGGCIPSDLFDLPVDFESLTQAGSIMGSGGMIVMDEDTCMVDVAKYFTNFLQDESCGKCVSCREGTQRMYEILKDITEGKGKEEDIELLEELGRVIKDTSMCGLGQTAPNPVISTLRYFRHEYISHIKKKRCPAGVCKTLISYVIDSELCKGCGVCKKNCPQDAIKGELKKPHSIDEEKCIKCGMCYDSCKFNAIFINTGGE
ncbi:MAG: NADH-quinone oxidoreductase subunit NuoF [Candidatus Thermoplasmatota archaeon]